jgi:Tol biopolymer transport system component
LALAPGTRLGPYEVIVQLGAGGMGEVYRARDTKLNRDVALKILPDAFVTDADRLARFTREAQTLAALNNAHVAHIHGLEDANGIQALVMEFVDGEDLAKRLTRGPIPLDEALAIARQIAEGLEAAHEQGIIHRDLKPANIKLTPNGNVKILDFGLAKAMDPMASSAGAALSYSPTITSPAMTMVGAILGTAAYMSPEQAKGLVVDKRCDIWAFGVVLYEMLTGRQLFTGETITDVLAAVVRQEPAWDGIPDNVTRLLKRCLDRDPKKRLHDLNDAWWLLEEPSVRVERAGPAARATWAIAGMAALVTAAVSGLVTASFHRTTIEQPVTRLDVVTRPTADPFSFALSTDGRQLAFVANGEHGSQLWVRSFDQIAAMPLGGTEGATAPFWKPDGRALGFFAEGKLKRIDLSTGGVPQVLADAPIPRGGTWNADGTIVFAPSSVGPLVRVPAVGGSVRAVTRLAPGEASHRWPQFLPDGHRVLFSVTVGQPETHGIYVASVDDGTPRRVMPAEVAASAVSGYLMLVAQGVLSAYPFDVARSTVTGEPIPLAQSVGSDDGTFRSAFSASLTILAYRPSATSRRQLLWLDRTGKVQGSVGQVDEHAPSGPELSPDGQRVALLRSVDGNTDVWLIDRRGVPSRFTSNPAIDGSPVWSPHGDRVAFVSTRNGVYDLFEKPASGAADERLLLPTSQNKRALSWSQDGRFLLFGVQGPNNAGDLWVLPMTGGDRTPFPVLHSPFDEIEGQFSPDGHWLAYVSNESGRYETYIRTFPDDGGKWPVSTAGGTQPRWRHDGKELFYLAPDGALMAVPIRVAANAHDLDLGVPVRLFQTHLAAGGNIPSGGFQARAQYDVASDGRFLMNVLAEDAATSPITIVQNWPTALKK